MNSAALQQRVDDIGAILDLPVSLTDPELNSLFFSPHSGDLIDDVRRDSLLLRTTAPWVKAWFADYHVDQATDPVRVQPHPDRDTMSRLVIPVHHRGRRLGLLCVLDPTEACTEQQLAEIAELIDELAQLMDDAESDRAETSRLVHDLLLGTAAARDAALIQLQDDFDVRADSRWVVAVVTGLTGPLKPPEEQPRPRRAAPRTRVLQSATNTHHVFLFPAEHPTASTSAQLRGVLRLAEGCCRTPVAGLGEPQPIGDAHLSYNQARAALSTAARFDEMPQQVHYADLGALRQLAIQPDHILTAAIDSHTQALVDSGDEELVDTITTYLDTGCDAAATAAQLTVHRGTLYYRLRKAKELSGLDLATGAGRLTLHVGLLAHRLVASPRRPSHPGPPRLLPY